MRLPISVIIPTMNRPESLDRTLKYMASGSDVPKQVIIIDQSQTEEKRQGNIQVANKYRSAFESVVTEYQQVPSLTKARNFGYTFATEEIVVLSDDDVDVHPDTFANVASIMVDDKIAMIAGIDELSQVSRTNIGYILGTKSYINRNIGHVTLSMISRYPDSIESQIETQWAQGYFFVVRKSLMDKWNTRWDENLTSYAYAEDMDFSYAYFKHAKKEGLMCVLDPSVNVKHLATLEFRIPNAKNAYMYVLNRAYLCHKHDMGVSGVLACWWCDLWRLVQRLVTRQNAGAFAHAMWCKIRYHKDIVNGNLDYDKFMG